MAPTQATQMVEPRSTSGLQVILLNLIILFVISICVSVVLIFRQQVKVTDDVRAMHLFSIESTLLELSKHNLHLQELLFSQPSLSAPLLPEQAADYASFRGAIDENLSTLIDRYYAIDNAWFPAEQLDRYKANVARIDEILQNEKAQTLPPAVIMQLSSSLLEMELAIAQLLSATQSISHGELVYRADLSAFYRIIFFVAMFLFAALISWTFFSYRQFVRNHQAIATELQASERRHRALLETIPDIVLRRTRSGYYTDFKPAKTIGSYMPRTDFIGQHVSAILPPEIADMSTQAAIRALDTGQVQLYEYRMVGRTTGLMTDFEARVIPSGDDEVQVIIRDITMEKQRSERQQQAQKLESLGVLAGGIAHDFNNLLTSIMAQISLAKTKLMRELSPMDHIDKALTATQRASDLTRQLLTYAGKTPLQVTRLDLNQLIQDNVGLLETALPSGVEMRLSLDHDLPMIESDRGHLQQVVMNLAINAADAIRQSLVDQAVQQNAGNRPEQRYIAITTAVDIIQDGERRINLLGSELRPGAYVSLQIQDNGIGMEQATIQRIFDPFFSTKANGHGLGLSATLGIVRSYGGAIQLQSIYGVGTTFTLFFPALQQNVIVAAEDTEVELNHEYSAAPKVLVIDDEISIREVVVDILDAKGFTVYQAANGEDGIAEVRRYNGAIDLVLLDMKMPGLSGDETLERLHQLYPSLKVLLSSGFTKSEIGAKLRAATAVGFLPKPYNQEQLLHSVNKALAAPVRP